MVTGAIDAALSCAQEGEPKPALAAPLSARVLDVSKADGIVDLSAAPALLPPATDAGKRAKKEPRADKWKVRHCGACCGCWCYAGKGCGASSAAVVRQVTARHQKELVRSLQC